ncbi:Cupredoxin [Diplocarpon rosae]|nr:Cupredoxin [Diplocarpon rosae]
MQFTTFTLSALSIGSALAQGGVTVHVVRVGSMNGSLEYFPNTIKAAVGDMVQFQFAPNNHTVTQSSFDSPCEPIGATSNVAGIYSGFMPVSASSTTTPTYTVMIKDTTPMWLYCSQGKHCQEGMTMVINENTAANSTRTLAKYQELAKTATVNLPGGGTVAGSGSSNSTGAGSASPTSGAVGNTNSTSGAPEASTSSSAAHHIRAADALGLGSLVAIGFALLL